MLCIVLTYPQALVVLLFVVYLGYDNSFTLLNLAEHCDRVNNSVDFANTASTRKLA
jgi:hypothetical protein